MTLLRPLQLLSRSQPWRARLALALAIALIAAQTLGLLHRTIHAEPVRLPGASAAVEAPATVATAHNERGWIEALFAGHRGPLDCNQFDQMGHADLAVGATSSPALTLPHRAELPLVHRAWHIAAQARGFLARGPPVLA